MGKNSGIEWTHHTFNPWWGCEKVSPACKNCYAEAWAKRMGQKIWGAESPRRFFGDKHWTDPLRWNAEAAQEGVRRRVFCASMADVFELRADLQTSRDRLWGVIDATPNLDWLLLTKRPENVATMVPWEGQWPENVWIGATAENQQYADERIPHLLRLPAQVRFLSCEPLLGPLDLTRWANRKRYPINWVIVGGESGHGARETPASNVRQLRQFCVSNGIAFHFKQWGHWRPAAMENQPMEALGKKAAGRDLDGRTWDEVPMVAI